MSIIDQWEQAKKNRKRKRCTRTIPENIPEGWLLVHNDYPPGHQYFNYWLQKPSDLLLAPCDCGWSPFAHYHENSVTRKAYHEACRAKTQANVDRRERERREAMTPEDLVAEAQHRREIEEEFRRMRENTERMVEEGKKRAEHQRAAEVMAHESSGPVKRLSP